MWIRPKGKRDKPHYVLVESRRGRGCKHPKQKIVCHMGNCSTMDLLVEKWELLLKYARTANRKKITHANLVKTYPVLKKFARNLSLEKIKLRVERYRHLKACYDADLPAPRKHYDPYRSMQCRTAVERLRKIVSKIRNGKKHKQWDRMIRSKIKSMLVEIVYFYHEI